MKNNLAVLIFILFLTGIGYHYRDEIKFLVMEPAPCTEPIPYRIGSFDAKFGISQKYFLEALGEAEAIWEGPSGRDLFTHAQANSSDELLKINLIYDYRQEATDKLSSLGITVNDSRASYDMLKAKLDALKIAYDKDKSFFNQRVSAFNQRQKVYGEQVDYWNKRGGAPSPEYKKLEAERAALGAESQDLNAMQKKLNSQADEINALVVALNRLITSLNLSVEKYNNVNEARGESFEEGVYVRDGGNAVIDIYEFSNRSKLVRVLAHELGHALGLGHVEDSKAIMYRLNEGNSKALTSADMAALEVQCGEEN